jgi:hypothetical protein
LTVEHLEKRIVDFKESLEREMDELRQEMRSGFAKIELPFDTQAARMDRHAALLQTGSRWSSRMKDWAEKSTRRWRQKNARLPNCGRVLKSSNGGMGNLLVKIILTSAAFAI